MTGLRDVFVLHTATSACLLRYGATVSQQACRSIRERIPGIFSPLVHVVAH